MVQTLLLGFACSAVIAFAAWRLRALNTGGAISGWIVGGIIFGLGGIGPSAALLAFFLSGSILSSLPAHRRAGPLLMKKELAGGYARNWKQVLANGALPFSAIIAARLIPSWEVLFLHTYYGCVAAACADSWGTEIGTRFGKRVHDAMTGLELTSGLSGGISLRGMIGSIGGAVIIAVTALLSPFFTEKPWALAAIVIAGLFGSIADSILGSTVQAKYQIIGTDEICEVLPPPENGDRQVRLVGGYKQIKNNSVNFIASAMGAFIILLLLDLR